ncbi:hypothetical protein BGW38_008897 [Lunasporangiospora selenospora]|uniref:Biogenesis of lysosome-related organelles complex 1 subunit 7 n=1 Tax=Lunasporangiospora selenospora TaxID=979761 RepID=A0A9P6KIU7_9FUNG|nr:hypothetical protein BGW38_008897 [Lunasporangiospora selenospora]
MSFFKKDYSAYPQPVVVTPDPETSIPDAVADAIETPHGTASTGELHPTWQSDSSPAIRMPQVISTASTTVGTATQEQLEYAISSQKHQGSQQRELLDVQPDNASQRTSSEQTPSQQDATKLAEGIMSLLGPIVQEMDFNIVSVRKSQSELEKEIERLMAASAAAPPEVEPAVQKLLKARRQIMSANSTLKTVQERVDRMHFQLERMQ